VLTLLNQQTDKGLLLKSFDSFSESQYCQGFQNSHNNNGSVKKYCHDTTESSHWIEGLRERLSRMAGSLTPVAPIRISFKTVCGHTYKLTVFTCELLGLQLSDRTMNYDM